jgi:hypothetical protein
MEGSMSRLGFVIAAILSLALVSFSIGKAPAWAVGTTMRVVAETTAKPLTAAETKKIETYMRHVLGNPEIRLVQAAPDAEVYLGEHFLGMVFPQDDREGRTFYFEMSIFDSEVEESPPLTRRR